MTKYLLEYYTKGARKPYVVREGSLPNGHRPTFTNSQDCFNYALSHITYIGGRVKVRYKSNGALAAETYRDIYGNGRLRWKN